MIELLEHHGEMLMPAAVVTGTHSSGKTTVTDDFARGSFVPYPDIDIAVGFGIRQTVQVLDGGAECPVIVVPEAARRYCSITNNPAAMLKPSIFPQLDVERIGEDMINVGIELASRAAVEINGQRIAALLFDRSPLDAHIYSELIDPMHTHDEVNIAAYLQASALLYVGVVDKELVVNYRQQLEKDARQIDRVFFTDETEVLFENDGQRVEDLQFRQEVANKLRQRYAEVLGPDAIHMLTGNRIAREQSLRLGVKQMIQQALGI